MFILRFAVCSRFTVETDIELAWAEVTRQVESISLPVPMDPARVGAEGTAQQ